MPRRFPCLLALLAAMVATLLTSCDNAGNAATAPAAPPEGAVLLADSAAAMRTVTTARASIDVQGQLPTLPIKTAQGQLTREGLAKGTATVDQGGQLVELTFVLVDSKLYLRGPTGGFRELPAATVGIVYDPSLVLNPDRGVAGVLASATAARTETREQVDGVDAYRVQASFSRQSLGRLVPGFTQDSAGRVWIAAEGSRLVQAQFPTGTGTITFRLFDFDAPADIAAPR